jgi:type IV secretion system protein VirB9
VIRSALFALALLASTSAAASGDPRLASRPFSEDEVVRIEGRLGVQASIAFGEDEHIENVAIGDSANWQVTPNKRANLLFIKPLAANARTNLTVVSDRHTYFFELVASPKSKPIYVLRFTYPDEPRKEDVQQAGLKEEEQEAIEGPTPADPAALNFAWRPKGAEKLLPRRIYDDGNATYLSWGAKQEIPAILVRSAKGEEGPVNYSVHGEVIVIGEVPGLIILRSGRASATLENEGRSAAAPESQKSPRLAATQETKEDR